MKEDEVDPDFMKKMGGIKIKIIQALNAMSKADPEIKTFEAQDIAIGMYEELFKDSDPDYKEDLMTILTAWITEWKKNHG